MAVRGEKILASSSKTYCLLNNTVSEGRLFITNYALRFSGFSIQDVLIFDPFFLSFVQEGQKMKKNQNLIEDSEDSIQKKPITVQIPFGAIFEVTKTSPEYVKKGSFSPIN